MTLAERLIELADALLLPRGQLMIAERAVDDVTLARIKLALDFRRLPVGKRFTAIVGEWDQQKMLREVY